MRFLAAITLAGLLPGTVLAASCEQAHFPAKAAGKSATLSFKADPEPIRIGQHFSVDVLVCASDGSPFAGDLSANAVMPAHNHGMNYKPTVTPGKDGAFRIDGLMFHMPGKWQFQFDLRQDGRSDKISVDYDVQ